MNKAELETMKVAELKQMCRERKMPLESKGHKFTKPELIDRLMWYEDDKQDAEKKIEESVQPESASNVVDDNEAWDAPVLQEHKEEVIEVKEEPKKEKEIARVYNSENREFAVTIEEIEKKYTYKRSDYIYNEILKVGSFIVFIQYVEAKNGNIYKKLRTAKVVGVNRKKELVRAETFYGNTVELGYEDLLYIKENKDTSYPMDIRVFLKNQRTEKGRAAINERFEKEHERDK